MTDLKREVRARASYDHRDDPDAQRGAGGLVLSWIVSGPLGAVAADINTGWMARPYLGNRPAISAAKPLAPRGDKPGLDANLRDVYPNGASVNSHCTVQRRDWWMGPDDGCSLVDGPCYGDHGYLVADAFLAALVGGGDEAAWKWLEECYAEWLSPETVDV